MSKELPTLYQQKVEPITESGCHIWMGNINGYGYGRYGQMLAHRLAYMVEFGDIPEGLVLDHLCRVPCCVNPHHLEPVTIAENVRRGMKVKTYCVNGHKYTEANTKYGTRQDTGASYRYCRECNRLKAERRNHGT